MKNLINQKILKPNRITVILAGIIGCYLTFLPPDSTAFPPFPGAEGFGQESQGGRGKPVFIVTNLKAKKKTKGSLPWALHQANIEGGGYIVFAVSGTIHLTAPLMVKTYIYIAGQTSPGGIAIDGSNAELATLYIKGHNNIIRHLRIRGTPFDGDGMLLVGTRKVVIDHCAISWFCNCAIKIINSHQITIQWTQMGDAMECNPKGYYNSINAIGGTSKDISIHHSVYFGGALSNPYFASARKNAKIDFRNNLIFNYRKYDTMFCHDVFANVIGNYFKPGPNTDCDTEKGKRAVAVGCENASLYVSGNRHVSGMGHLAPNCEKEFGKKFCANRGKPCPVSGLRPDDTYPEWAMAGRNGFNGMGGPTPGTANKLDSPLEVPPVKTHGADEAYRLVLEKFGAFPRDKTDRRIAREIREGTGVWRSKKSDDKNKYAGKAPKDKDKDGMPDSWEKKNGGDLKPNGHDLHKVYDNIEVYLNELADKLVGSIFLRHIDLVASCKT